MKILVFGTFDHLHPGHLFLLEEASKRGELHVVVGTDENVFKIKGRRPDQPEEERTQKIRDAFPGAQVLLGHESDYLAQTREIQPNLILLGYDQKMPPGITEGMLGAPTERLPAFEPDKYKSSLLRDGKKS